MIATTSLDWSLISSSIAFSAFSAVLSAFMFAAMVLLLTRELRTYCGGTFELAVDPLISRPIVFMFGAFFSLVIAAFLFAAMSGDANRPDTKEFIEGVMPSFALALGVVQMAVGLAWLLQVRGLIGTPMELARAIAAAAIVIAGLFLSGVIVSPMFQTLVKLDLSLSSWVTWAVLVILLWTAILLGHVLRSRVRRLITEDQIVRFANIASIVMAVLAAVGWNVLSSLDQSVLSLLYTRWTGNAIVVICTLLICAMLTALEVAMPDAGSEMSTPT